METAPEDNILDATKLSFAGDFDLQVMEILTRVRLTRAEVENLQCLLDDVLGALTYVWPGCQVHPFGSITTGLGIKTSDIDCYVNIPTAYLNRTGKPVNAARNVFSKYPRKFTAVFAIRSAKVPIVKFLHIPTRFNCDINFSSMSGVKNSKLIAFLLHMDPRALHLAILIKYWSKVYNFTGTNLMPNYALTMMIIFYLQVESVLPSVAELQRDEEYSLVENWNTAFNDSIVYVTDNAKSLYELLGGFFNYYKNFNFEQHVISPFLGCPIKKLLFADLKTIPNEYRLYKENMSSKVCKALRLDSSICIQDPFDHSRNCSVVVLGKLFLKIHGHIDVAACMYNELESDDFLRTLLTSNPQKGSEAPSKTSNFKNKHKVMKRRNNKQARLRGGQSFTSLYINYRRTHKWATKQI